MRLLDGTQDATQMLDNLVSAIGFITIYAACVPPVSLTRRQSGRKYSSTGGEGGTAHKTDIFAVKTSF